MLLLSVLVLGTTGGGGGALQMLLLSVLILGTTGGAGGGGFSHACLLLLFSLQALFTIISISSTKSIISC